MPARRSIWIIPAERYSTISCCPSIKYSVLTGRFVPTNAPKKVRRAKRCAHTCQGVRWFVSRDQASLRKCSQINDLRTLSTDLILLLTILLIGISRTCWHEGLWISRKTNTLNRKTAAPVRTTSASLGTKALGYSSAHGSAQLAYVAPVSAGHAEFLGTIRALLGGQRPQG